MSTESEQLEKDLKHDAEVPREHKIGQPPTDSLADQMVHGPKKSLHDGIELESAVIYLDLTPSWWAKNEPEQMGKGLVELLKLENLVELRATAASLVAQVYYAPKELEGLKNFRNTLAQNIEVAGKSDRNCGDS